MATTARLDLWIWRNDDVYEFPLRVIGPDLRGIELKMEARLIGDTPGPASIALATVTNGNAEGIRLAATTFDDLGNAINDVRIRLNKSTRQDPVKVPYMGELGDTASLSYALLIGGVTRLVGRIYAPAHAYGSDNAPVSRPIGYGQAGQGGSPAASATLQISQNGGAALSVGGLDVIDEVAARLLSQRDDLRARLAARAALYGVTAPAAAKLFAAEATELGFADDFYRDGYSVTDLASVPGLEMANGPAVIDGRGVLVAGDFAIGIGRRNSGDVTVIIDVDLPNATDRKLRTIVSYVGSDEFSRIAINRNEDALYTMQLYHPEDGLKIAVGPQDASARRMRLAFTIGAGSTRVSFAGAPTLAIASRRPPELLRVWLGRFALGYLDQIDGHVLRAAWFPHAVSDDQLRQMAGGPVTDDDITNLIDEKIKTHDNDDRAHDLQVLSQSVSLTESRTGIWTVAAADNFNAADGALTTAPVGGQAYTGGGLTRSGQKAVSPDQTLRGTYLVTTVSDGQVEAELDPGNDQAALYFRLAGNTNSCFLLLRGSDSVIRLFRFPGSVALSPLIYRPFAPGEKIKARFVGKHIWIIRSYLGDEEVLFEIDDAFNATATGHGFRISGTGKVDNFRVLNRDAI